jgi:hypothetical protein
VGVWREDLYFILYLNGISAGVVLGVDGVEKVRP